MAVVLCKVTFPAVVVHLDCRNCCCCTLAVGHLDLGLGRSLARLAEGASHRDHCHSNLVVADLASLLAVHNLRPLARRTGLLVVVPRLVGDLPFLDMARLVLVARVAGHSSCTYRWAQEGLDCRIDRAAGVALKDHVVAGALHLSHSHLRC